MISWMDRDVGRLIGLLRKLEIDRKTLVIFTSDNGPHSEGGHKHEFFDANGASLGSEVTYSSAASFDLGDTADTITIDVVLDGDGWALDYSELTVTGIPLPAPFLLLGGALLGLGFVGRKRVAQA